MTHWEDDYACEEFFAFAHDVIDAGRLRLEARFVQHGSTSTLLHSIAVAAHAEAMAYAMGYTARLGEVRRAALLHDYYLYDWHEGGPQAAGHATRHAGRALKNALADYPDQVPYVSRDPRAAPLRRRVACDVRRQALRHAGDVRARGPCLSASASALRPVYARRRPGRHGAACLGACRRAPCGQARRRGGVLADAGLCRV